MAAIATAASGNYNATGTWTGAVIPVSGDTVTVGAGHILTVPAGYTAVCGTSPATGGAVALTLSGNIVINGTLIVRGPVIQNNVSVTMGAGSILEFDSSLATTPFAQKYNWRSAAFALGNRTWTANGTTGSHITIRSNAGGGNGWIDTGVGFGPSLQFAGTGFVDCIRLGDNVNPAISLNSNASTQPFYSWTFDANCGVLEFQYAQPATGGWDIQDCRFLQTNPKWNGAGFRPPLTLNTAISPTTGLRKLYRCVFTRTPVMKGFLTDIQDCLFLEQMGSGGNATKFTMTGSLIRLHRNTGQVLNGDPVNSFVLYDTVNAVDADNGTVTSSTSTVLTDSTKVWTGGCFVGLIVKILSGTGAGQWREVLSNTATTINTLAGSPWTVTPDATSTYAITTKLDNGTATGATTTTLTDTGKTFDVNAFNATNPTSASMLEITGGTGIGQRRLIISNTATALTIAYRWDTIPTAGSTYTIYQDSSNNHGVIPDPAITSGYFDFTGNVFQDAGVDTQGDCILHCDTNTLTGYRIKNNIVLPNGMGDSSGTLLTMGGDGLVSPNGDVGPFIIEHNTVFAGAQSPLAISEGGKNPTGSVPSFQSNIVYVESGRTYYIHGGTNGPFAVNDTDHTNNVALNNLDIVTTAGHNNLWNLANSSTGDPYCFRHSVTPGTGDVIGNPGFVDRTRSFWTWAVTRGSSATTITGQVADGLTYITADPTLTRLSLIPYIQAGLAPTNPSVKNAGHDGVTMGAVPGVFPASHNSLMLMGVG